MQSLPQATKLDRSHQACAGALLNALPGLMRFVRHHMRSRRAAGLSVPQFRTLVQLHRRPATSLSVVAEALGATAPTTSRVVSGLVRKGLVLRRESRNDRREVSLELTPRGQAAMKAAWAGTQEALAERLEGLSASGLAEMTRCMAALSALFGPLADHAETGGVSSPRPPRRTPGSKGKAHSSR